MLKKQNNSSNHDQFFIYLSCNKIQSVRRIRVYDIFFHRKKNCNYSLAIITHIATRFLWNFTKSSLRKTIPLVNTTAVDQL